MGQRIWNRLVTRETVSYVIFGVLTTLVNWAVYAGMVSFRLDYRLSTAVAWLVSVLFAFVVNKVYVFQSYEKRPAYLLRELTSFVACRGISGVMEMVFMIGLVSGLRFNEYLSKILVSAIVLVVNYIFSKLFIFRKKLCEER